MNKKTLYHLCAISVVIIWGITFISTKVLLRDMSPAGIMFCRFLIAYIVLWLMHPKRYPLGNLRQELLYVLGGICGGTIYFLTENSALGITLASNVSLIITTVPILTAIAVSLTDKTQPLSRNAFYGFLVAIAGVALVIFNGNFILKISPLGDFLALASATSWAAYTIVLGKVRGRYHYLYTTRKIFLYALLTMSPIILIQGLGFEPRVLLQGHILWNLLFLGVVASSLCYAMWNVVVDQLGAVRANSYIYLTPVVTMLASVLFLDEPITVFSLAGGGLTILGVYLSENGLAGLKAWLRPKAATEKKKTSRV